MSATSMAGATGKFCLSNCIKYSSSLCKSLANVWLYFRVSNIDEAINLLHICYCSVRHGPCPWLEHGSHGCGRGCSCFVVSWVRAGEIYFTIVKGANLVNASAKSIRTLTRTTSLLRVSIRRTKGVSDALCHPKMYNICVVHNASTTVYDNSQTSHSVFSLYCSSLPEGGRANLKHGRYRVVIHFLSSSFNFE